MSKKLTVFAIVFLKTGVNDRAEKENSEVRSRKLLFLYGLSGKGIILKILNPAKALRRKEKMKENELEQLAPCVKKLHKVTEKVCKENIEMFI